GYEGAGADLEREARDGEPGARPDRIDHRLGDSARVSTRREPGAVAWPSREPVTEPTEDSACGALSGTTLCRDRHVHGRAATARWRRCPGARICNPDCRAHRRSDRSHV